MRKMHVLSRMALETVSALAAALLIALSAAAAPAPNTISSEMCNYASNKAVQLQAELKALFISLGFTGLPPDECDKFVNNLVKSCLQVVWAGTQCSLDVNTTVGLNAGTMSEFGCDAEASKDDQKSCKLTAKTNTRNNLATAGQAVQQIGANTCNSAFALNMREICLEGVPPP
jgi:hypothetical protein